MRNKWFESIAVAQKMAKRRLPRSVYGALIAGAGRGVTSSDNMYAFDELTMLPVTAGQPA
ncbi:MAG: alpha-hydroxy-acid oxidizing enzyme, partial [Actinomycetota bacterium]